MIINLFNLSFFLSTARMFITSHRHQLLKHFLLPLIARPFLDGLADVLAPIEEIFRPKVAHSWVAGDDAHLCTPSTPHSS